MTLHTSADAPITCAYWDELVDEDGFLALGRNRYHCSYVIYTDGTYYYAENGTTGNLDFGGPNNLGGVSGISATNVTQAAIDAVYVLGGGKVIWKSPIFSISNLTIKPGVIVEGLGSGSESATPGALGWKAGTRIDLTGSITMQSTAYLKGVLIHCVAGYVGNAVVFVGTDNPFIAMKVLDDIYFYCPTQTGTALLLSGVTTATANAAIDLCTFGDIYIQRFEYGLRIVSDNTAGMIAQVNYNVFEFIGTWGTKYSITWQVSGTGDAGGNVFHNVIMQDAASAHAVKGIQVSKAQNVFLSVAGVDFLVSTIDILAAADSTFVRGLIPYYIDLGTNSVILPLTTYPDVYYPTSLGLPEFYRASVVIPFSEQWGVTANDISRSGEAATLVHAPVWGTQGQLYKITLDGANDYATLPSTTMGGSRTYIIAASPDFLETENALRYLFAFRVSATNYVQIGKTNNAGANAIVFEQRGGGGGALSATSTIGFAQNDTIIIICTFNTATGAGILYVNGVQRATFAGGLAPVGSAVPQLGRYDAGSGFYWLGWVGPFGILPRVMPPIEVQRVSEKIANLVGYNLILKNSGTATIAAAATSIVVAHGCSYTPSALDVSVVLTNLPTNDIGDVYVDTFGAANFTIHCRNVPGAATAIFNWAVRRV